MQPNEIFIGRKPAINYVLPCSILSKDYSEIYLRARGDNISKAVDVALIAVNRFIPDFKVENIQIETQSYQDNDKERKVSVINICLKR